MRRESASVQWGEHAVIGLDIGLERVWLYGIIDQSIKSIREDSLFAVSSTGKAIS